MSNAGSVLGPLVGAALLRVDLRVVSLAACLVFAALTAAQVLALPRRAIEPLGQTVLASWGEVLRNGRFLAYTLAGLPTSPSSTSSTWHCRWRPSG